MDLRPQLCEPHRFQRRRVTMLLGAGASYDHGYPLVQEFLSPQYYQWLFDQCTALPANFGEAKLEYFLAGTEKYRSVSENFEEVLSVLYGQYGPYSEPYAELLEFIYGAMALAYELKFYSRIGSTAEYVALASLMLEHCGDGEISVVTFNYDTSIEESISTVSVLLAKAWPAERLHFNYGFEQPVRNAVNPKLINWASRLPNTYPGGRISILKPHGSVNIMHCSACAAVVYFPFQTLAPGLADSFKKRCPTCLAGPLYRLIVPPGKRKEMPAPLKEVWRAAESTLASSDVVVVMGYSLPSYDVQARVMIESALQGKDVIFVDPRPSQDAVSFLRAIPETTVQVVSATATAFLRTETDCYDPRLRKKFAPLCADAPYLYPELLRGHSRVGAIVTKPGAT